MLIGANAFYIQAGEHASSSNAADIRFTNIGGSAERMRILSGGGVTFNGDTAAANALDDYEEGTWTPAGSANLYACLLYTSPSPRDGLLSRMPSSA